MWKTGKYIRKTLFFFVNSIIIILEDNLTWVFGRKTLLRTGGNDMQPILQVSMLGGFSLAYDGGPLLD